MQDDAVREALDSLIRMSGEGYAALSRMIGRNPAYLQQFIKRGVPRRLAESDRRRLARHFGVSERLLGSPEDDDERPAGCETLARNEWQDNPYILVPYLDSVTEQREAGAPQNALAMDPSFAVLLSGGRPTSLAAHRVRGDSMVPTLADGDNVMVDVDDHLPPRDGIYAIRTESGVLIKRISVHPVTRRLSIMSDNAAYPAFYDCDPTAIGILGRVIWAGRRIA